MTFVLGPCASVGVQVNTPLVGLIMAPAGAPGPKEKVNSPAPSMFAVVRLVIRRVSVSTTACAGTGRKNRDKLGARTITSKVCAELRLGLPSSETRIVI